MLTLVFLSLAASASATSYAANRCFDCNYYPSGYGNGNDYGKVGKGAGSPHCALLRYGDQDFLDQWACKSGRCFIRLDKNGLIYRGCADKYNLPYGVNPYLQCQHQASSLWYFCTGDLCNDKQLGQVCSADKGASGGNGNYYNPCDGVCYNNPSGLFKDPYNPRKFIQCGCGNYGGHTCTCCVPFRLMCPYGTFFDDYQKTCTTSQPVQRYPPPPPPPPPQQEYPPRTQSHPPSQERYPPPKQESYPPQPDTYPPKQDSYPLKDNSNGHPQNPHQSKR